VALRCLIVDDNATFLAAASRLLSAQGLEVVGCASSGSEALQLVEQVQPDAVLVDVQLGDENGLELARRLGATAQAPRVILISSHSPDELTDFIGGSSAAGFVSKAALSAEAITTLTNQRASR
jgi:DNA-binding NarL/FixJ family response regulator